jgi:hypothetical protein
MDYQGWSGKEWIFIHPIPELSELPAVLEHYNGLDSQRLHPVRFYPQPRDLKRPRLVVDRFAGISGSLLEKHARGTE